MAQEYKFRNPIAASTFHNKYALTQSDTWPERSRAIVEDVCGTMSGRRRKVLSISEQEELRTLITNMKFIPGGRYIYYGGRRAHFFNNCLSGSTEFMTPSGKQRLDNMFRIQRDTHVLSPIDGQWHDARIDYHGEQECWSIQFCNVRGPQETIRTVTATGDHRWLRVDGTTKEGIRVGDIVPATSPVYDGSSEGFLHGFVFGDGNVHILKGSYAHQLRLCGKKRSYLERVEDLVQSVTYPPSAYGDPVLYIKSDVNLKGLPLWETSPEYLKGFIEGWIAADGHVGSSCQIHTTSREAIDFFCEYSPYAGYVVTGNVRSTTAPSNYGDRQELFIVNFQHADTYAGFKVKSIEKIGVLPVFCVSEPETTHFTLAGGMATGNCFCLRAEEDTREEWGALAQRSTSCLMTGGGIGVDYSILRGRGYTINRTGGTASGPLALAEMINSIGQNVMQGGSRRSAIYASLNWRHPDAKEWLYAKDWDNMPIGSSGFTVGDMKRHDYNFKAPLDMTNISLNYDDEFLNTKELPEVFLRNVRGALSNGEPGFSFNFGTKSLETLRNA